MSGNAGIIQAELQFLVGNSFAQLKAIQDRISQIGPVTGAAMAPANQAVKGLEKSFKDFKREQVQEGRLFGFYAREIGSFVGASSTASAALGGMAQGVTGLIGATNPLLALWAAFEIGSAAVGWIASSMKETEENAKKAADSLAKVGDRLVDLERKRRGVTEADVEGGRVEAARRLMAARDAASQALSVGGGQEAQDAAYRRYEALEKEVAAWEKVNGKLETYVALQAKVVDELRAQEAAKSAATSVELAGERRILAAKGAAQTAEAQFTNEVLAAQRKWLDGAYNVVQLEEAIANASQKRAKAMREVVLSQQEGLRLSRVAGNMEYEMAGGDSGQLLAAEKYNAEADAREKAKRGPLYGATSDAASADQVDMPGAFGDAGLAAKTVADMAKQDAADVQTAWQQAGSAMASGFSALGNAIGGTGGKMLAILGQMLASAISVAIAYAAMAPPPWGAISMAAMAVGLIATIASAAMTPAPQGRAMGGSVFPGSWLVGENGPELLRLGNGISGSVVPNHQLATAGAFAGQAGGALGGTVIIQAWDGVDVERVLTKHDRVVGRVLGRMGRSG